MEMSFMQAAQALIRVEENSQVGEARRNAVRIAELTGLLETDRGKIGIIATELANNLVRHSRGGEIIIRRCKTAFSDGVELLAIDRGPGMSDVGKCMTDGFSTGGTAGTGFGAVRRLSSEFDVYSAQPSGTIIVSRVLSSVPGPQGKVQCGVVCVPAPGEIFSGDNWSIAENDASLSVFMADGLGHGPLAAKASDEAVRIFNIDPFRQPYAHIDAAHSPLRSTRGAAVAVAHVNLHTRQMKYAGVGNISGSIIADGESRGLFTHNGTVGLQIRKIQEFDYVWPEKALLIMHSDGLQTRWDLKDFPGLLQRHPAVIAGVLYRDFVRGRDDVTVAVLR